MYKLLLISLIFSSHLTAACEFTLPARLLIVETKTDLKNFIHSKNCSTSAIDDLTYFLIGTEGRIAPFHLRDYMLKKGHDAFISSGPVVVENLLSLVNRELKIPPEVKIVSIQSSGRSNEIVALDSSEQLEISPGYTHPDNPLKIVLNINQNQKTTRTITFDLVTKKLTKAYRLTSFLPSFSQVADMNHIQVEYVERIPQTELFNDFDSLKFYVTNKPLKAGELLRRSDLNAINLVRAGLKTQLILENDMIRIKTQGISRSNGAIGDMVEVYHPDKKIKYQGKVIDINKVSVEL
jgi:flagella basal body P-ring formation protein FlgA